MSGLRRADATGDVYLGGWRKGQRYGKGVYFFKRQCCQFYGYWGGADGGEKRTAPPARLPHPSTRRPQERREPA